MRVKRGSIERGWEVQRQALSDGSTSRGRCRRWGMGVEIGVIELGRRSEDLPKFSEEWGILGGGYEGFVGVYATPICRGVSHFVWKNSTVPRLWNQI